MKTNPEERAIRRALAALRAHVAKAGAYTADRPEKVIRLIFTEIAAEHDFSARESFAMIALDSALQYVGHQYIEGTLGSCMVYPREVFRYLFNAGAAAFVVLHNHPSGSPMPSAKDVDLTELLRDIGDLIGCKMIDSFVLGEAGASSVVSGNYYDYQP